MAAIPEAALAQVGVKLDEAVGHFLFIEVHQSEFADAGGVDQLAAAGVPSPKVDAEELAAWLLYVVVVGVLFIRAVRRTRRPAARATPSTARSGSVTRSATACPHGAWPASRRPAPS